MSTLAPLRPWLAWIALAVAIVPIADALLLVSEPPPQIDDAYISYRYAQNLAEGHGQAPDIFDLVQAFLQVFFFFVRWSVGDQDDEVLVIRRGGFAARKFVETFHQGLFPSLGRVHDVAANGHR